MQNKKFLTGREKKASAGALEEHYIKLLNDADSIANDLN
jgi:hypothetical protein